MNQTQNEAPDLRDGLRHPLQPLAPDDHGTVRFKENAIVRYLLDAGPFDLNVLAGMDFSREDWEQLAQLIGYSLSGFGGLSYVSGDTYAAADAMFRGRMTEERARIVSLETTLADVREGLRHAAVAAFDIHPDTLGEP